MGLLGYQAMPSLRDVAHDGVCVHLVIDHPQTGASGVVRQGRRHRPSITYKTTSHPAGSLSSSQTGGPPCWARHLAYGLIGVYSKEAESSEFMLMWTRGVFVNKQR
jgi:hypothetical protein